MVRRLMAVREAVTDPQVADQAAIDRDNIEGR